MIETTKFAHDMAEAFGEPSYMGPEEMQHAINTLFDMNGENVRNLHPLLITFETAEARDEFLDWWMKQGCTAPLNGDEVLPA